MAKRSATARWAYVAAGLVAVSPAGALAALPPYWQSAREITAIVNDPRVHDALKYEEPITSVISVGSDQYEVGTERCSIRVSIVTKQQSGATIGPRQFDIEVGTAECR